MVGMYILWMHCRYLQPAVDNYSAVGLLTVLHAHDQLYPGYAASRDDAVCIGMPWVFRAANTNQVPVKYFGNILAICFFPH
jgi:hypothetical protein